MSVLRTPWGGVVVDIAAIFAFVIMCVIGPMPYAHAAWCILGVQGARLLFVGMRLAGVRVARGETAGPTSTPLPPASPSNPPAMKKADRFLPPPTSGLVVVLFGVVALGRYFVDLLRS